MFILSLVSASAEATAITHDKPVPESLTHPQPEKALRWGEDEIQKNGSAFCLVPSEPGCSGMWMDEKKRENNERIQRRTEKSRYPGRE